MGHTVIKLRTSPASGSHGEKEQEQDEQQSAPPRFWYTKTCSIQERMFKPHLCMDAKLITAPPEENK